MNACRPVSPVEFKLSPPVDSLVTKSDLSDQTIDGIDYVTFQPNTIVYAVDISVDGLGDGVLLLFNIGDI